MRRFMLFLASVGFFVSSLGPVLAEGDEQETDASEEVEPLVRSVNSFAFDLYASLASEESPGNNLFVSPLSIHAALAMTHLGASGASEKNMKNALRLQKLRRSKVGEKYRMLFDAIQQDGSGITLNVANTIRVGNGRSFSEKYRSKAKRYYSADAKPLSGNPTQDAEEINRWVDRKTEGMIEKLVEPGDLRNAVFALLNAIYFKGAWTDKFNKERTEEAPFHLVDGSKQQVQMMSRTGRYETLSLGQGEGRIVRLPYGKNERFGMIICLPGQDQDPVEFFQTIYKDSETSSDTWSSWMKRLKGNKSRIRLSMPRFQVEYGVKPLNGTLKELGFPLAELNMNRMGIGQVPRLNVLHKAVVKVNEKGTEAAAATGGIGVVSLPPAVKVNRPFLFAIRDRKTGLILFMGTVYEPEALSNS